LPHLSEDDVGYWHRQQRKEAHFVRSQVQVQADQIPKGYVSEVRADRVGSGTGERMSKEFHRNRQLDRSAWASGPWDNEPDFYEWTTGVGYEAHAYRLDSGAWAAGIIAPYPTGEGAETMGFHHTLRDKRWHEMDHSICMVSKTDREDVGEYCLSMEHWASPGPAYGGRDWNRGPYKTLDELKQICEEVAQDIFNTHKEGTYVNYFRH
jgi:hypothetical protein